MSFGHGAIRASLRLPVIDSLPDLIKAMGGQTRVGRMLGKHRRTVNWWVHHKGWPEAETARALLEQAGRLQVSIAPELRARLGE